MPYSCERLALYLKQQYTNNRRHNMDVADLIATAVLCYLAFCAVYNIVEAMAGGPGSLDRK